MINGKSSFPWTRRELLIRAAFVPALRAASSQSKAVNVLSVPRGGIQPQIAVCDDVVHMIYFAGDPKQGDVFYTRSNDFGGKFSPAIRVNSQLGSAIAIGAIRGAQLSVGKGNRVHVAWNGSDTAEPRGPINPEAGKPGSPMLYARLDDRTSAFEPQRNLIQETFGLDGGGTIAADHDGNVYVGWHGKIPGARQGEAGRQVWIARSRDEGRTFAKERPVSQEPTGACGCCGMRLFADSRGVIHGLYRSARENVHRDIYAFRSEDGGNSFSVALLHPWNVNACPMSSMNIIEHGSEVFGAWETQTQVYFAPLSRGMSAARAGMVAPSGENPKRKYPALARNKRGETLLAWVEGAGWQRGGVLGWQFFDKAGRPSAASEIRQNVPVWSFPAVFARPDESFAIVI
ncbi:MAG TPA: sialidase family protein [Bryobacteraceae bacterium]|nr:sialidase family protein [Bryobacteraceae bacterium]